MIKTITIVTALFCLPINAANIYKCDIDGVTTFSQMPCPDDAENIELLNTPAIEKKSLNQQAAIKNKVQSKLNSDLIQIDIFNLKQNIKRREAKIQSYKRKMVKELAKLKLRTTFANNNLAGATYQNALSEEMSATTKKYEVMIKDEERIINELKSKKEVLSSKL